MKDCCKIDHKIDGLVCQCGSPLVHIGHMFGGHCVYCGRCGLSTPRFTYAEDALYNWKKLTEWYQEHKNPRLKIDCYWTAEDVQCEAADHYKKDLTMSEAETILCDCGGILEEAMVDTGWEVIRHALYEHLDRQE